MLFPRAPGSKIQEHGETTSVHTSTRGACPLRLHIPAVGEVSGGGGGLFDGVADQGAEPLGRAAAPGGAVALAEELEAGGAPPAREVAQAPVRLDLEADFAGVVLLRQQEPLVAALDVALEGVVAEAEVGAVAVRLLPHAVDPAAG